MHTIILLAVAGAIMLDLIAGAMGKRSLTAWLMYAGLAAWVLLVVFWLRRTSQADQADQEPPNDLDQAA